MNSLITSVEKVVREAGLIAKQIPHNSRTLRHKKSGEPVTSGDIHVEEYVISSLKKLLPDSGFNSEERGQVNIDAEYIWILDPIDGTKYYAKDLPLYSVSLALEQNKRPLIGVVYCPEFNRMYFASTGGGATINDKPIHCSDEDNWGKASICLEIPSRDSSRAELKWALEKMAVLIPLKL